MGVTNHNYWKQLYNEGRDRLIEFLSDDEHGDFVYETFGIMINAYEPTLKEKNEVVYVHFII